MKNYIARVLVEHIITPRPQNYSAFSEIIILGKAQLPDGIEFSQLLFDKETAILEKLLDDISQAVNDDYLSANQETVCMRVREIVKIEDCDLQVQLEQTITELDERLYTFGDQLTFEQFKDLYDIGRFAG